MFFFIRVEEYVRQTFENTNVKIEVVQGQTIFEKEYPCLAAVNRCATSVPRHDGRVIWLTYEPEGTIDFSQFDQSGSFTKMLRRS